MQMYYKTHSPTILHGRKTLLLPKPIRSAKRHNIEVHATNWPSAFEGKMAGRWGWRPKRRPSYLREAGVSDIHAPRHPQKRKAKVFGTFPKKYKGKTTAR